MFNGLSSPLSFLHSRRSGKPRDMVSPGPDAAQLDAIFAAATRVPDHGKLAPWRFVVIGAEQREDFAAGLHVAYALEKEKVGRLEAEAIEQFARQAPCLIVALFSPKESHIPQWEQQLSVGAACMQLLNAVHAQGFVGGWLTGWATYSDAVRDMFGAAPEQIAGFIFVGTPSRALEERPRPERAVVVSQWKDRG